jgi:LmbE family N-acetylglucosaminyl deacetylase
MMKNPYLEYVKSFDLLTSNGRKLPFGDFERPQKADIKEEAPIALIMSPHPDDECIMGALPLRLMREAGFRIIVCAITLGSNLERRKDRLIELKKACEWLGFELQEICDGGLSDLSPKARNEKAADWSQKVSLLTEIFKKWSPSAIFFPNSNDWNQTHLGVHLITLDSVTEMNEFFPFLIETEYWGQMPNPNLLAESSTKEVSDLIGALSHHKGEILRNPFHIRLPAWMQDNVRRGAEVVGGQGAEAPNFNFATLYRVNRWNGKGMVAAWEGGKMLPSKNSCDKLISEE